MGSIVKSFIEFVNEGRAYYNEQPTLYPYYKDKLNDFAFEHELLSLVQEIEQTWINMKNKYWWNREYRASNKHFALDVKVYIWPDVEKAEAALGREISEDGLHRLWYQWMDDQREAFVDNINYSWVKDVSFGGKSGGWLLVAPNVTEDDAKEQIEELVNIYLSEKKNLQESESWPEYKQYLEDQDYSHMVHMGMIDEPEMISDLRDSGVNAIKILTESRDDINEMITGLEAIEKMVDEFRKEGAQWFYDYLEQERSFIIEA
jgi:hypothetical protein